MDYRINCGSALRLLKKLADEKAACRMISLGSRSQYGKTLRMPLSEGASMHPLDIQAVHKLTAEHYHALFATRYGLDLLYLRMTNVYGPGQRLRGSGIGAIGEMLRNALNGEDLVIYGSPERIKDIIFVGDAVQAILLLGMLKRPRFNVYNLGGQPYRMDEVINAIKRKVDINMRIVPFPGSVKKMDAGDAVLNIERLKGETRWAPATGIREGIAATLDYYKKYERRYL
jgi:UDP-glucose 4-epimerase